MEINPVPDTKFPTKNLDKSSKWQPLSSKVPPPLISFFQNHVFFRRSPLWPILPLKLRTSPIVPSSISFFAYLTLSKNRWFEPTWRIFFDFFVILKISRASSTFFTSGFSQKTCFPALRLSIIIFLWNLFGVQTHIISIFLFFKMSS